MNWYEMKYNNLKCLIFCKRSFTVGKCIYLEKKQNIENVISIFSIYLKKNYRGDAFRHFLVLWKLFLFYGSMEIMLCKHCSFWSFQKSIFDRRRINPQTPHSLNRMGYFRYVLTGVTDELNSSSFRQPFS